MRTAIAAILATSLFVSSALAADSGTGPLAPGKPAGTKQADIEEGGVLLWLGILGVAAGIAVIASTTQGKGSPAPVTTS
jgi:hypothetical protein